MRKRLSQFLLVAFYTISNSVAITAAELPHVTPEQLCQQIKANIKENPVEARELTSDLLFVLSEKRRTSKEKMKIVASLVEPHTPASLIIYNPALNGNHLFALLKDFKVESGEDLQLLNKVLESLYILNIPKSYEIAIQAHRLANEVQNISASTSQENIRKIKTLLGLASLAEGHLESSRSIGAVAMEAIANSNDYQAEDLPQDVARIFASYQLQRPFGTEDGHLYLRDVNAAIKIANSLNNNYALASPTCIAPELFARCSSAEAVSAMEKLVKLPSHTKFDSNDYWTLCWQLGCAYILDGKLREAHETLEKNLPVHKPLDQLCLAECMRREKQFKDAKELVTKIANTKFPAEEKNPDQYIAIANAIHAQICIDQKKFVDALPLLESADDWYSKVTDNNEVDFRFRPFVAKILPDDERVVSNLVLVNESLKNEAGAETARKQLTTLLQNRRKYNYETEKDYLLNQSFQYNSDPEIAMKNAKRFIDLCETADLTQAQKSELLFSYAEKLIAQGSFKTASICLDACMKKTFVSDETTQEAGQRVSVDLIAISEERGDTKMSELLADQLQSRSISEGNKLRAAEVLARAALLSGNFQLAEEHSRIFENKMNTLDSKADRTILGVSAQDKFIQDNQRAFIDRIQALNHLKQFSASASLARKLVCLQMKSAADVLCDGMASLAYAYFQTGHTGLANALESTAVEQLEGLSSNPNRYLSDAKSCLADMMEKQNPLRARRYRFESQH